jgi:hypothetical protein
MNYSSPERNEIEPKLVPILREGIDVIKMVVYVELKSILVTTYSELKTEKVNLLSGAVVNSLFGVLNMEEPFKTFEKENRNMIEDVLNNMAATCDHLKIPLTDALRIQFLCDGHEGVDSASILERAKTLNLLILERDVPLPGAFMSIVRSFGTAYKILEPQAT